MSDELPNFLIIGAARTGTTTLYSYLQGHPDVYLPANKRPEPHFFLKEAEYRNGLAYYQQKYFAAASGQRARGEASTSYICHEWVAERIRQHLPDVKLIAMLRQPAERAFSNYWHSVRSGVEKLSFEEAIRTEDERTAALADEHWRAVRPYSYLERGFYLRQLEAYLRHFARDRLHVIIFEDFVKHPGRVLGEVLEFLGVDATWRPDKLDLALNASVPEGTGLSDAQRRELTAHFSADIAGLESLLGRNLEEWRQ